MHSSDEELRPHRDIYQEILNRHYAAMEDQAWDEIEELCPEIKKYPRIPFGTIGIRLDQ